MAWYTILEIPFYNCPAFLARSIWASRWKEKWWMSSQYMISTVYLLHLIESLRKLSLQFEISFTFFSFCNHSMSPNQTSTKLDKRSYLKDIKKETKVFGIAGPSWTWTRDLAHEANHCIFDPTNLERINRFFGSDSSFPSAAYNFPLFCALQACLFPPGHQYWWGISLIFVQSCSS